MTRIGQYQRPAVSKAIHWGHVMGWLLALVPTIALAAKPYEFHGFDPDSYSPVAREGLQEIFLHRGAMSSYALPLTIVEAMAEAEAKRDLGYDPTSVEGKYFSSGALPSPPSRGVDQSVALGQITFERDGAMLSTGNCFGCHAGMVKGIVVAGLGNNSVMQRPPQGTGDRTSMFALTSALKTDAERKYVTSMMSKPRGPRGASPIVPETTSRGDNFGPFGVWAKGTRLVDPANKGLVAGEGPKELAALIKETKVPPVDPMAWWLMKYKTRDYWYGDGAPDDAGHFAFNFTGTGEEANETHQAHVESTAKVLAYARETQAPLYPGKLNPDLVKLGADLFHGRTEPADEATFRTCADCHGTYSRKNGFSDLSEAGHWAVDYSGDKKLRSVGTDKTYNEVVQKFDPINTHISKLAEYHAAKGTDDLATNYAPLKGKGYVPPPLVGVWATAPYFHNGSVPTINAVLNSKERPEIWERDPSSHAYNLEPVGLVYTELSRDDYEAKIESAADAVYKSKQSLLQMFAYDTAGFGRSNQGHTFGDSLTQQERMAVIEFLKSLSGPDM